MAQPDIVRRYFHVDVEILTGTAAYADVVPARTGFSTFLTEMTLSITSHVVGDVYTIDDDGAGAVIGAHTDAAAAAGVPSSIHWDFGDIGTLVTGNVDVSHSSTGVARLHLEGYYK